MTDSATPDAQIRVILQPIRSVKWTSTLILYGLHCCSYDNWWQSVLKKRDGVRMTLVHRKSTLSVPLKTKKSKVKRVRARWLISTASEEILAWTKSMELSSLERAPSSIITRKRRSWANRMQTIRNSSTTCTKTRKDGSVTSTSSIIKWPSIRMPSKTSTCRRSRRNRTRHSTSIGMSKRIKYKKSRRTTAEGRTVPIIQKMHHT